MIQCFSRISNATTGSGTRFASLIGGGASVVTATQGQVRVPIPVAGTFKNLRVRCRTGLAASSSRTFFVYLNGTITGMGVTIGAADTTIHSDIVNTVTVAAGDSVALGTTLTGTDANVALDIAVEFETAGNTCVVGGSYIALGDAAVFHNITSHDGTNGSSLAIDDSQSVFPCAGTFTRFDVRLNAGPGGSVSRVFTIYKNGTAQDGAGGTPNTTVTITGAATTGTASFSLTVAEGDLLSVRASVSGGSAAVSTWQGCCAFSPTTAGQFPICASDEDSFSAVVANFVGQSPLNWDATEANVAMIGNITTFQITGWRIAIAAADNGRTFTTRVNGSDIGPSGTLAGGATTLAGAGDPAIITSADSWSFKTLPGANGRNCLVGLNGTAQEEPRPGPIVNGPFLRFSRIGGGMVN